MIETASAQGRPVQRFEREPEDQTTVVGETVVMACRVINKSGDLQWTKDDFGLGSDRNLSGFERYSMIGSEDEGNRSLSFSKSFSELAHFLSYCAPVPSSDRGERTGSARAGHPANRALFAHRCAPPALFTVLISSLKFVSARSSIAAWRAVSICRPARP